jgi:hypothetical protein
MCGRSLCFLGTIFEHRVRGEVTYVEQILNLYDEAVRFCLFKWRCCSLGKAKSPNLLVNKIKVVVVAQVTYNV